MDPKNFLVSTIGTVFDIGTAVLTVKIFMDLVSAKSKMLQGLRNGAKGITQKVRDRAERTNFFQRRKMADEAKVQEQRRANVEDYASRIRGQGIRSTLLRRRAAGGAVGQVFNTNRPGQERQLQAAEDVLRKQRHEEAERAAKRMKDAGFRGDDAYLEIARSPVGRQITSPTGQVMSVTHSDQQAAINSLVQQGRTSQVRGLEAFGGARGAGGAATSDMHTMLDHAYEDYGSKLADKAPDLMPDRRTTEGLAAFTDLKPDDVSQWHHSTVSAARAYYSTPHLDAGGVDQSPAYRDQMLRAFSQATQSPTTRSKLSLEQVTQAREILHDAVASGQPVDPIVSGHIETTYTQLGGT
ncbi:MAG TPA: hypothetical protein VM581_00015 [Magnetospirillaceae bacterium]|nr:hypothetical protein [Magnetospirillaceae bacterium]